MPLVPPRARPSRRRERLLANTAVAQRLISVSGLTGAPVIDQTGGEFGKLVDVIVRWQGDRYPPVTGLVVRVGRRATWIGARKIESLEPGQVRLRSAKVDLRDFERRPGEVRLTNDVVDHQMVDVDGVRVFRASDLYLARLGDGYRLVGADIGVSALLRRIGPSRRRSHATPDKVIDWGAIQPFSEPGGQVHLRRANADLHRLRPADLADLLEELGRNQRQELLDALDADTAADALEEMERDELSALLRDAEPNRAALLVAEMEPDEAADALRDLDDDTRDELLAAMPSETARELTELLTYDEGTAGGVMTTNLVSAHARDTVAHTRGALIERRDDKADIDSVVVVDDDGLYLGDVDLFDLLCAEPDRTLERLLSEEEPVTVTPETELEHVVRAFVATRGTSVVVVDDEGRAVGRVLGDDVVDALLPDRGRFRFRSILP
jgi:CBS domain-containing protein